MLALLSMGVHTDYTGKIHIESDRFLGGFWHRLKAVHVSWRLRLRHIQFLSNVHTPPIQFSGCQGAVAEEQAGIAFMFSPF